MKQQLLIEHLNPVQTQFIESHDSQKNLFLVGKIMAAEQKNLNGRIYPLSEIAKAVKLITEKAGSGEFILGELTHPDNLTIDLKNVSHIITEAWMDGSNAIGRCKILNTPSGIIVKNLIEGGVKLGVSSRGTGNVTSEGMVESFDFVTLDIVGNPSGPGCYPDAIREAQGDKKILTLAEAVQHDPKAQKYLTSEILKFITTITRK